jgi:hypothetical protein
MVRKAVVGLISLICFLLVGACAETPAQPRQATMLSSGAWTGDGCLGVTAGQCELVVGCGHGVFPAPTVSADGTFNVEGTYRVEAGPISADPAPPATFSGVLKGQTLTLTVTPRDASGLPRPNAMQFVLQFSNATGRCVTACV